MAKYLCGIDVGTTGAKTMILDLSGNIIGSAYREYPCEYPKPNWVEQDIVLVKNKTFETCREAIADASIDAKDIVAISLSTQRTTSIFIDKDENVLKTISWQDNRTADELEDIKNKISAEDYYEKTGLPLNTTWIITKALWMQKREPQIWDKVSKIVQLQDYLLRHLGADDYYVDYPDACLFGCFDNDKNIWDRELMEIAGVNESMLPKPTPPATNVGCISKETAEITGFAQGTPICVGAGDQNSASIGAGIVEEGIVSVSLGTGGMAIAYLNERYRDPKQKACITSHAIANSFQFEGYQIGAASVFKWFKDEIANKEVVKAQEIGKNVYELLNEEIEKVPVGAKGLILLPYFGSSASPRWNPSARGTLVGLTFAHDRACLARAFMEGITFEQKDILTNMSNNGIKVSTARIIGGATKSNVWNQIQADMYNMECHTLKVEDAAVVGAAIFAGVAVGVFENIKSAVKSMVHIKDIYKPIEKNVEVYNELFDVYRSVYEGFEKTNVFEKISNLQREY